MKHVPRMWAARFFAGMPTGLKRTAGSFGPGSAALAASGVSLGLVCAHGGARDNQRAAWRTNLTRTGRSTGAGPLVDCQPASSDDGDAAIFCSEERFKGDHEGVDPRNQCPADVRERPPNRERTFGWWDRDGCATTVTARRAPSD